MDRFLSKSIAGIASATAKSLTTIILDDFKYKYCIKCDQLQRNNDYEKYRGYELIDESVYKMLNLQYHNLLKRITSQQL